MKKEFKTVDLRNGDSLEVLKTLQENSVDSIVCDPPYGLSFMGKKWDYDVPSTELWIEAMRVLKPGGHLLSFAGSRTYHRMAVNIEDAGFEIRDQIMWVYGSGFPKSHNIGKAVDKLQGNERVKTGEDKNFGVTTKDDGKNAFGDYEGKWDITKGTSEWEGWGTALKPSHEPIVVARKPLSEKTIANNVLEWGTGGINIDGCRVGDEELGGGTMPDLRDVGAMSKENSGIDKLSFGQNHRPAERKEQPTYTGRFPANFIHDGSDEVVGLFPDSKSGNGKATEYEKNGGQLGKGKQIRNADFGDSGSASRFFYCAKASKKDRNEGLEEFETSEKFTAGNYSQSPTCKTCDKTLNGTNDHSKCLGEVYYKEMNSKTTKNNHPTVKPTQLMQYLVRLVTPKGGTVLDPFMGSGSTGKACMLEGFNFIGIDLDPEYVKIAQARIDHAIK